jgi:RUN domain-containing protein 1
MFLNSNFNETDNNSISRLKALEKEQEQLNYSLMSLTTHFAQVQFRLKQIIQSPDNDKESLLKDLEEFAYRGCPDLNETKFKTNEEASSHQCHIEEQREKQKELMEKLKCQLEDLENYAYETGTTNLPSSSKVMEKQRIIIDELREKINLPIENLNNLSNEDLKKVVDNAIHQMINPTKVKEQLVTQLKTQIDDLERFIDFLQGEASSPGPYGRDKILNNNSSSSSAFPIFSKQPPKSKKDSNNNNEDKNNNTNNFKNESDNETAVNLLKKMLSVMQIFAITQFGCGSKSFEKNTLKKSTANHWGDMRASLELAVAKVIKIHINYEESKRLNSLKLNETTTTTTVDTLRDQNENEDDDYFEPCPHDLIKSVRKDLACSLRDLMQHGLIEVTRNTSIVPFGCFVVRSKENQFQLHTWDLLMKYYDMKHGKDIANSPANTLSQSFNLNVVSGRTITIKQSLLNAIGTVIKIHKNDLSNKDSCFKAFVCLALK